MTFKTVRMTTLIIAMGLTVASMAHAEVCNTSLNPDDIEPRERVVYVNQSCPGSFHVIPPELPPNLTLSLKGHVCEPSGQTLGEVSVKLVEFTEDEAAEIDPCAVTYDALRAHEEEWVQWSDTTDEHGGFSAEGLRPSRYALVVDWDGVEGADVVVFNFQWSFGLELSQDRVRVRRDDVSSERFE